MIFIIRNIFIYPVTRIAHHARRRQRERTISFSHFPYGLAYLPFGAGRLRVTVLLTVTPFLSIKNLGSWGLWVTTQLSLLARRRLYYAHIII
jgi:hypothetical protein